MPFTNQVYEEIFVRAYRKEPLSDREQAFIKRLMKKFTIRGEDDCWEWFGSQDTRGYGILNIVHYDGKKQKRAHRLAYCLYRGEIPPDMEVCHHCDNPACLNPKHLFLGTQADNMKDRHQKNRFNTQPKGEDHGLAVFTTKQVKKIRSLYLSGEMNQYQLADKYKTDQSYISVLINQKTYTPTNPDGSKDRRQIMARQGREIYKMRTMKKCQQVYADRRAGMSYEDLMEKYQLAKSTIWRYIFKAGGKRRKYRRRKKK